MRLKKIRPFLIALLFAATGCSNSHPSDLQGTWRLQDVSKLNPGESTSFEALAAIKQQSADGLVTSYFADGSFTELSGNGRYDKGRWTWQGQQLVRHFELDKHTDTAVVSIATEGDQRPSLKMEPDGRNMQLVFLKDAHPLKDWQNDQFYWANNTWRIKPAHREDTAQLRERLLNYIRHVCQILQCADEREQRNVSFEFSLGPIKIYNGGIGIHNYSIVPDTWKHCFYDDADAQGAYGIFSNGLRQSRYHGANTGKWVKDDYNILLAVYNTIRQQKPADKR
jgi:hypothetical protein